MGGQLLVCCEDGNMMAVEAPRSGLHNITKTYQLDLLKISTRKFATIKDRLRVSDWDGGMARGRGRMRELIN